MPREIRKRPLSGARKPAGQRDAKLFAFLSLGCFFAGLLLLWLLVAKAEMLVRLGLEGKLYYLVLLPLGLAVAGFLFGVLRSFAHYRGKAMGGVLELGGPIVAFGLVVLGGFQLVPPPESSFSVTVFVHGEGGVQDVPLRAKGHVVIDLGPDRRREAIGAKGEAFFPGIPGTFRGQEVPVWLDAEGFAPADSNVKKRLDGSSLYLAVKRQSVTLRGRVQDQEGQPIPGASVRLRDLATTSDDGGSFSFGIPGELVGEDLTLSISAPGYEAKHHAVEPGSNDVVAMLRPIPRKPKEVVAPAPVPWVRLVLAIPAGFQHGTVLVDGEPARVLTRLPNYIDIQVPNSDRPIAVRVEGRGRVCEQTVLASPASDMVNMCPEGH